MELGAEATGEAAALALTEARVWHESGEVEYQTICYQGLSIIEENSSCNMFITDYNLN